MKDKITLLARINKSNKQVNFQLKKSSLPKDFKDRLPSLKGISIKLEDFDFI